MATSVPVPIASPTSAAASAGASLTPSPANPTTRPSSRNRLTTVALVIREDFGLDAFDAEAPGHGFGGDSVVTGEHDHLDPVGAQGSECLGGGLLDGVGEFNNDADIFARAKRWLGACHTLAIRVPDGV